MPPELTTEPILETARERGRGIFHLHLDPTESLVEHKILVDSLAPILMNLQNLLRHAYKKTGNYHKKLKDDFPEAYKLQVNAFSAGSVVVEMEAHRETGLFENIGLAKTLNKLDELVKNSSSPEAAVEIIRKNKGRVASSYIQLMKLLQEKKISLDYAWAMPTSEAPSRGRIQKNDLESLLKALGKQERLKEEDIKIKGRFRKVDVGTRSWKIRDEEDGKEYSGKVADENPITLDGIIMETQIYKITCREVVEVTSTGQEKTLLLIEDFQEI